MKFKVILTTLLFLVIFKSYAQESKMKKFKQLSCPEKCWVIFHPFAAKKALKITEETRKVTKNVMLEKLLKGNGHSGQVDAFRHTFWMARLTKEIGWRRAKKLGKAHEKGNYKDYKKNRLEDGIIPDEISSEMDLFNNSVGIELGKRSTNFGLKKIVVDLVLKGNCKIIKRDASGNYLDCEGNILLKEQLKGKWVNDKCLVKSNYLIN
jgi:hypothetical protein